MADKCCCGGKVRLIFPCSGGSDVGELTDRSARKLTENGWGKMYCLAGVGAHLSGFIESTKTADAIITIDGCPAACAAKTLEHAGFKPKKYNLKKMGFFKGQTPVSNDVITRICTIIQKKSGTK
jgi:uncharacterized metal-binding protein